jgi:hypothetical protein
MMSRQLLNTVGRPVRVHLRRVLKRDLLFLHSADLLKTYAEQAKEDLHIIMRYYLLL